MLKKTHILYEHMLSIIIHIQQSLVDQCISHRQMLHRDLLVTIIEGYGTWYIIYNEKYNNTCN